MAALKLLTRIVKKKYLSPFSLIARLSTAMFCLDKQLTILLTVLLKKTEKWASFQLRPVYTTIIYCKKVAF